MFNNSKSEKFSSVGAVTAILLVLYLSSLYNYLLFHSLIEITTIAIGFTLFILTWNTRRFLANNILGILGIGYAFVALIDLLHTLAYKGMNVFPGFGSNLAVQLWIAARYMQAFTLLVAPLFIERRIGYRAIFGIYAAAVSLFVAMVYSGYFPVCYIEGKGLTRFKIDSEYVITTLLLISLYLFYKKRKCINDTVLFLTLSSIAGSAVSGILFTSYVSVYGFANMAGHFLKLAAYYLIYRAIVVTGLREPFDIIFRDLKQTEETLRKSHDSLEETVSERTAELRESELQYRALAENSPDCIGRYDRDGRRIYVNPALSSTLGLATEEAGGTRPAETSFYKQSPDYKAILLDVLATGVATETELVVPDTNGCCSAVFALEPVSGCFGTSSDII